MPYPWNALEELTHDDLNAAIAFAASQGGGSYTLPIASTVALGGVKVDGATIAISGAGVISVVGGGGGGAVSSVAGRTGAVVLTHNDLTDWTSATAAFVNAAQAAAAAPVQSVAGRTGAVVIASGDVSGLGGLATLAPAAQGAVLYSNGSAWATLAPGTAGQVLQSGGAGANPSWAAAGGGGASLALAQGALTFGAGATVNVSTGLTLTQPGLFTALNPSGLPAGLALSNGKRDRYRRIERLGRHCARRRCRPRFGQILFRVCPELGLQQQQRGGYRAGVGNRLAGEHRRHGPGGCHQQQFRRDIPVVKRRAYDLAGRVRFGRDRHRGGSRGGPDLGADWFRPVERQRLGQPGNRRGRPVLWIYRGHLPVRRYCRDTRRKRGVQFRRLRGLCERAAGRVRQHPTRQPDHNRVSERGGAGHRASRNRHHGGIPDRAFLGAGDGQQQHDGQRAAGRGRAGVPARAQARRHRRPDSIALGSSIVFGTEIPSYAPSTAPNTRDLLQLIYAGNSAWMLVAVSHGFGV
jgi:hypothetical protein